jgi:hypothetical protein
VNDPARPIDFSWRYLAVLLRRLLVGELSEWSFARLETWESSFKLFGKQ